MADMRVALPEGNAPVAPLTTYTIMVTALPLTVARNARVGVRWYDAAHALIGAAVFGAWTATSLAAPTDLQHVLVSPAGAASAGLLMEAQGVAVGEQWKLDDAGVVLGDEGEWVVGGELDQQYGFTIERSEDGGETWTEVRDASIQKPWLPTGPIPASTIYDYEAPLNVPLKYRARTRKLVEVS